MFFFLLLVAACTDDPKRVDAVGAPRTEIVDQGTGPENAEALWPLVVGAHREQHSGTVSVPDRTQMFGRTVYRFQGTSTVSFYYTTEEGVFSAGSLILGALPRATLLVPAKVKVGLKWRSFQTDDLPSVTSVVTSVELKDTIFGRRMVWTIAQTDESHPDKVTYTTSFAEGRGPVELDGDATITSILPLDPDPPVVISDRLPLTPLNNATPLFLNFWATRLSAMVDATGKATIRAGGITAWFNNPGFGSGGAWDLAPQSACVSSTDGATFQLVGAWTGTSASNPSTDAVCPEASAALFAAGTLHQLDVSPDSRQMDSETGLHLAGNGAPEHFYLATELNKQRVVGLGLNRQYPDHHISSRSRVYGGELLRAWTTAAGQLRHILIDKTAPSDDFGFVAMVGDRLLAGAVKGTAITPLELVGAVPGARLSTKTTPNGREHYLVTADGVVDRLHIGNDGDTWLERYAELDLPVKHEAVGVIPFDDHLLVLAVRGREGDPINSLQRKPILGDVVGFSAPLPAVGRGRGPPPLPHHAITAEVLDRDLKVCWPKGAGPAITSGWTLGGQPATAIVSGANGDCVVLLRDKTVTGPLELGAYAAEGMIPGVGRVAIGTHPQDSTPVDHGPTNQLAALAGGGFTSTARRYGNAGDLIGVPANPLVVHVNNHAAPDIAGNGLWSASTGQARHVCLHDNPAFVLTGPVSRCVDVPSLASPGLQVGGGGTIWRRDLQAAPILIKPDGTATPITGWPAGVGVRGALVDGRVCGTQGAAGAQTLFCAQAGVVTSHDITDAQYKSIQGNWVAVGDAFYSYHLNEPVRFNPTSLTFENLDLTALTSTEGYLLTRISSGGVLFVAHYTGTDAHLYEVDGTTLVAADPTGYAAFASEAEDFVITDSCVIVFTKDKGLLRFPRL